MSGKQHYEKVGEHFGRQADRYLHSSVHARGEDLQLFGEYLRSFPESRLLDVGCGGGHVSYAAAAAVRSVTAYDLSPAMLGTVASQARELGLSNIETVQGKAEAMPFEDGAFDLAASRLSAHHWRDMQGALREIRRVLKPRGVFVLMDIITPGIPELDVQVETITMLHDSSHVHNLSAGQWARELNTAGFRLESMRTFRLFLELEPWLGRMQTPKVQADALRALQAAASTEARNYFEIKPDGSFTLDTVILFASRI